MALKDLKSDLSKFRMPKKDPLASKERVDVNKNLNKTPLSSMVDSAPKIPRSQTTTNKEGVNPQKVNQSEKFKGETTPQPMDNSEKFKGETTPKPMSLEERYLGQTDPTMVNQSEKFKGETSPTQMDNSEKFKGETSPKEMNNSENFLGETTPNEMNNSEQFLGETTPTPMSLEERFLGETNPTEMNNSEQFLGETTPNEMNNSEQFLGETTPNESDRSSKFLGETTPNEMNNSTQFLGETTPVESDRSSKFLGETTPVESDRSSKFLGETTPVEMNIPNGENGLGETTPIPMNIPNGEKQLGETTPTPITQGDRQKGETTPTDFTFSGKLENEGKEFQEVNYLTDIHALGFNSKFGGVEASKFVGVNPDNTVFDGTTSLFGDINNNSFTLGKTYGGSYNDAGGINSGEEGFGIGMGHAKRQSPSFLDEQYSKFNLKEDSFNRGLGLFRQPFILRGIQRKKISKGEPQVWGLGGFNYDEGAIRGGIVTSTVRALIDVARIGSWFASVPGILWGAKQFGMQRSQKFGKVWTPAGMLAAIGGQHVGLKAQRPGLIPLVDDTFQYQDNTLNIVKDKLETMYKTDLFLPTTLVGTPFVTQTDAKGGFNSLYGINIMGPGLTTRGTDTFDNQSQREASARANHYQWYTPVGSPFNAGPAGGDEFNTYGDDTPLDADEAENFGLGKKLKDGNYTKYDDVSVSNFDDITINTNDSPHPLHRFDGAELIKSYETVAYGNRPDRCVGDDQINDFRDLLEPGQDKSRAEKAKYVDNSLEAKFGFQNPGIVGADRTDYEISHAADPIQSGAIDADEADDLVKLIFNLRGGGSRLQFRGTVNGLTETFSPSWDGQKYNGRADSAFKYNSFERSLSFNFQVYPTTKAELVPLYEKLSRLASMTMPKYGSNGYQGILMDFTLGSMYVNQLTFIDSLSYTYSDEVPWDIDMGASMGVDVAIGLKLLANEKPKYSSKVYDFLG